MSRDEADSTHLRQRGHIIQLQREFAARSFGGALMLDHDNLEEFADAAAYDRADSSDVGVAFYLALARETGGPVLELACGAGRVGIPLAQAGFAVTGLDVVPGMIAQAHSKSAGLPTRWIVGDARSFDLGEQFRLIFLTGNAFQLLLTNDDQRAMLQRVHAHLHDDGLFAFETRNPRCVSAPSREGLFVGLETRAEEEVWPTIIDADGREIRVSRTRVYDHVAQILHWTTYHRWRDGSQEHTSVTRIALRYTWPQELTAILGYNGLAVIRQYGDWNGEPLSAMSNSIIVVCRKR